MPDAPTIALILALWCVASVLVAVCFSLVATALRGRRGQR